MTESFFTHNNKCEIRTTKPHRKTVSLFEKTFHDAKIADLFSHRHPTYLARFAVRKGK